MTTDQQVYDKLIASYGHITTEETLNLKLKQIEECVLLKAYDDGVETLNNFEAKVLDIVLGKLKEQIWPS